MENRDEVGVLRHVGSLLPQGNPNRSTRERFRKTIQVPAEIVQAIQGLLFESRGPHDA